MSGILGNRRCHFSGAQQAVLDQPLQLQQQWITGHCAAAEVRRLIRDSVNGIQGQHLPIPLSGALQSADELAGTGADIADTPG